MARPVLSGCDHIQFEISRAGPPIVTGATIVELSSHTGRLRAIRVVVTGGNLKAPTSCGKRYASTFNLFQCHTHVGDNLLTVNVLLIAGSPIRAGL